MPTYSGSFPTIVYKQSTQPAVEAGAFWYDTSTTNIYFCDGTNWTQLDINLGELQTPILENTLEILQIQAANSLTATSNGSIIADIYSDTTGYKNTIDTGNTNATFASGTSSEAHGQDLASSIADTSFKGVQITIGTTSKYLMSVTKHASCTALYAQLRDSVGTILSTASFSGNTATFTSPELMGAGMVYFITCGSNGASYTSRYKSSVGFPIAGTSLNFTNGCNGAFAGSDVVGNLTAIGVSSSPNYGTYTNGGADKIVQTNEQTLSTSPNYFQIFTYKGVTTGTGAINYDISFDSGAHYQTSIADDTATQIINTGTGLIIKQNLDAGASAGNATAAGYGVIVW